MLPSRIVGYIFTFLDGDQLLIARQVNKEAKQKVQAYLYPRLLESFGLRHNWSRGTSWIITEMISYNVNPLFLIWFFKHHNTDMKTITWSMEQISLMGNLNFIKTIVAHLHPPPSELGDVLMNAALGGQLDVFRYLHAELKAALGDSCWIAAEYNYLPIIEYLHENKCPFDHNSLAQTACYGMCEWLLSHGYGNDNLSLQQAINRTRTRNHQIRDLLRGYLSKLV